MTRAAHEQHALSLELHAQLTQSLESGLRSILGRVPIGTTTCMSDKLGVSSCTCHVGFHTNAQIIGNLLHMTVQLALFPRPFAEDIGIQARPAIDEESIQTELLTATMETQTLLRTSDMEVQAVQEVKLAESQTHHVTVDAGVAQTDPPNTVDCEIQCQQQWVGTWDWAELPPTTSPGPLLPLSLPVQRSLTPTRAIRIGGGYDVLHDVELTGQCLAETRRSTSPARGMFAHGAPSRSTSHERFGVGIISGDSAGHLDRGIPYYDHQLAQPLNVAMPDVTRRQSSPVLSASRSRERLYRVLQSARNLDRPQTPNNARTFYAGGGRMSNNAR